MGDKTAARQAMIEAGVPVTPGSEGNLDDANHALKEAERIGYPVMLKATSGGGGRGIRRCDDAKRKPPGIGWSRSHQGLRERRGLP